MTQSQNPQMSAPADDEIDLGRLFGLLLDHKWWIVGITAVFALFGILYAVLATPIYQGDALVQVERRSSMSPLGELSSMLGEGTEANTSAEVQILQSRMVLGQVVDRLELDKVVRPVTAPLVGDFLRRNGVERPGLLEGVSWVWGDETLELGVLQVPQTALGKPLRVRVTGEDGYDVWLDDDFLGRGEVGELERFRDGLIELHIVSLEAAEGAEFAVVKLSRNAAIRDLANRLSVSEVGGGRNSSTGMLNLTLTGPDQDRVRRSLDAIAQVFLTQNVERQSAEAEQSLSFLEEQAPEIRNQLATAENRLNDYRVEMDSVDLSSEAQAVIDQYIDVEQRLNEIDFQEAELAERYTRSHPRYESLIRQRRHLEAQREELNDRVNDLPEAQQEVVRLNRDVQVTQAIYVNVLNKMQELQIAKAGTIGNVRIIDTAVVGNNPIEPRRPLIVVLATMLGGMLAVGGVLARGLLFRGLQSPDEIEEAGMAVYATVPRSAEQDKLMQGLRASGPEPRRWRLPGVGRRDDSSEHRRKSGRTSAGLLAQLSPTDNAVEALRGLRTSLHFAMLEADDNRLVVTGPSPGVGKSFITSNLAAVCAQSGLKVVVIDGDMRKGHLHDLLGGRSHPGLSDVLSGQDTFDGVLRTTADENLFFVARGSAPPNPSELLMQDRFTALLDEASRRFDLVLIDTPPVLAVTDAAIVAAQCSSTLMVARFEMNTVRELQVAARRLETAGVNARGVILNAVERKASSYYGYYGYYNYTYK